MKEPRKDLKKRSKKKINKTNIKTKTKVLKKSSLLINYNNPDGKTWNWPKLPKGWYWLGGGTLIGGTAKYYLDDQFVGPERSKEIAKKHLKRTLDTCGIDYEIVDV